MTQINAGKGSVKMTDIMEYKGFKGTVEFSSDDNCLFGSVMGIKDDLLYEGYSFEELERSFRGIVEKYLAPGRAYRG